MERRREPHSHPERRWTARLGGAAALQQTLAHDREVTGATWNADESPILTRWSGDGTARVWEAGSDTPRNDAGA